ncbi:GNAT family N-acetyltransferase [Orrella marina]|uniref:GNAT family N-acetyltransferase n=1 Tax=Orrella marina TaxID=2163011 RepID=A0A2R4XHY7_9BURK|nr:GNAT family N-acetyltransferase [Orrella marina]AWB33432.1 GNAT family N-acetyltransferase [Orrella marina]
MNDRQDRYFDLPDQAGFLESTGGWALLGADALSVREDVFVNEQNVPPEIEQDDFDVTCMHIVIYSRGAGHYPKAIATGRVVVQPFGEALTGPVARIGRLAVRKAFRGIGLGTHLLTTLIEQAESQGLNQFELHSRVDAMPLYQRFGFLPSGPAFDEAGTPHILMVRSARSTD